MSTTTTSGNGSLSGGARGEAVFRRWSCEGCRRRRKKCDGVRPACGFCVKLSEPCVYHGTMTRVDETLAARYQAAIARRSAATAMAVPGAGGSGSKVSSRAARAARLAAGRRSVSEQAGSSAGLPDRNAVQASVGPTPAPGPLDSSLDHRIPHQLAN
ncbi:hypothetical protein HK405_005388 [Cladochytrium tenue]|nr:hypothetical protein HK405_005388 [Cladochytrium tenue]